MNDIAPFLLSLGAILLLALLADALGKRTPLPRVTLLLLIGALIGEQGLNLVPNPLSNNFEVIANIAGLLIGFLLGRKLDWKDLRQHARSTLLLSIASAVVPTMIVGLSLYFFGLPAELAILLGCISAATAPAATYDVVAEYGKEGKFSRQLLTIVAFDDAWSLLLFGIGVAVVAGLASTTEESSILLEILFEILGAVSIGVIVGIPASWLTGRIKKGQLILTETLAVVFICGGIAMWFNASFLMAAMITGAVITNFANHHNRPFQAIEMIEWPVIATFFVLAGASLDWTVLAGMGSVGVVYVVSRSIGKLISIPLASTICSTDSTTRRWLGAALLPQAGVAIGMALVAGNQFPEHQQILISLVVGSTVLFEIIGPFFTRLALQAASRSENHSPGI